MSTIRAFTISYKRIKYDTIVLVKFMTNMDELIEDDNVKVAKCFDRINKIK